MNAELIPRRIWLILAFFVSSCLQGPSLFKQSGDGDLASMSLKLSSLEDGAWETTINANAVSNQSVGMPDGTTIDFPAGSLSISTSVTIESGSSLTSSSMASATGAGSLTSASSTVVITAGTAQDASSPFSLEIPMSSASLRLSDSDPYEKLIVLFKRTKANTGELVEGMFPRADITVRNGKAKFSTNYFGAFQLAYTQNIVSAVMERPTTAPIMTKRMENKMAPVVWSSSYLLLEVSNPKRGYVNFSATGLSGNLSCYAVGDRSQSAPFDIQRKTESSTKARFYDTDFPDSTANEIYYLRFDCEDAQGRLAFSPWYTLFDPKTDPRKNGSGTSNFTLTGYTASTIGNPQATGAPLQLTFSTQPEMNSLKAGVSVMWAETLKSVPLAQPQANGLSASILPAFGYWPVYSPLSFNVSSSVKNASGGNLDKNYTIPVHTAEGSWSSIASALGSYDIAMDASDSGYRVYVRSDGSQVYYNVYRNGFWLSNEGSEVDVGSNLSAFIQNDGTAYVAWLAGTTLRIRRFNAQSLTWDWSTFDMSLVASLQVTGGYLIGNRIANSVAAVYPSSSGGFIKFCRLDSGTPECPTAIDAVIGANPTKIVAKMNSQGDVLLGFNYVSSTFDYFKALLIRAGQNPAYALDTNPSVLFSNQSFDIGIFDRKPSEAVPRALVLGTRASANDSFPFYFYFNGSNWSGEQNFLGSGNTLSYTHSPSISVNPSGNATLACLESANKLHVRMFKDYGVTSNSNYFLNSVSTGTTIPSRSVTSASGVAWIGFSSVTSTLSSVSCINGVSLVCAGQVDIANVALNAGTFGFVPLVDPVGNFSVVFQDSGSPYALKAIRAYYNNPTVFDAASPKTIDPGTGTIFGSLSATMDMFGRIETIRANPSGVQFGSFK